MSTPSHGPASTDPTTTSTRTPTGVGRRTVLATGVGTGVAAAGLAGVTGVAPARATPSGPPTVGNPRHRHFQHGIASGDPLPHSVLIWTRVTPTTAATPGSGKGPRVGVRWEVATDRRFRRVVRHGTFHTGPSRDHTVKVDVTRLRPATTYYYRFVHHGAKTEVGRTRTAPAVDATPDHLRFGVVSCANLQAGFFSAYRGLAARDDLHAIVHLGDYLYEYGPGQYGMGQDDVDVRTHVPAHEMVSLADYRQRHAQYKQDRDLQAAHRKYAWITTWDDHEVANDAYLTGAENHQPGTEGAFKPRRARAHRAYDEWMPVRMDGTARLGDGDRLYRRLRFGKLLELSMLDLRTFRSKQVSMTGTGDEGLAGVNDPDRTITGKAQLRWLEDSLGRDHAPQWKIVGNPVMIAPVDFGSLPTDLVTPVNDLVNLLPQDGVPYNVDQWDGYTVDRSRLFGYIRDHQIKDVVFITGDIHSGWAADLPYDTSLYPLGDTAGVEFVCTSVTSNNLKDITGTPRRTSSLAVEQGIKAANRHIKYLNFDDHGFSVLDVTSKRAQMDWYVIGSRADRDTRISHTVSYETVADTGRITQVSTPVGTQPQHYRAAAGDDHV